MCTVVIHRDGDITSVSMNRDEWMERSEEQSPAYWKEHMFGPKDTEHGGTWIMVTNEGVIGCVLNAYPEFFDASSHKGPSRGMILPTVFDGNPSLDQAVSYMPEEMFLPYAPCTIILADRLCTYRLYWDGMKLQVSKESGEVLMFTSSSWEAREVIAYRQQLFAKWQQENKPMDEQGVPSYMSWCEPGKEAYSPFVKRPKTITKSTTHVQLLPEHIRMFYKNTRAAQEVSSQIDYAQITGSKSMCV